MNIEELREYCLSLPGVTEATPFEKFSRGKFTILVFYVGGHMFCYFNIDDFTSITIKGDPLAIAELKERYQQAPLDECRCQQRRERRDAPSAGPRVL